MKQQRDIEKELIQIFVTLQAKVTNFVIGSVIRSFFTAISASAAEIWNDLLTIQRTLFWTTAKGSNLDYLGQESGLTRLAATEAETIVVFSGEFITGESTSVAVNTLTDTLKTWVVDNFINGTWILMDNNFTEFVITANTVNSVTINGTPAAGTYYILPMVPANTIVRNSISNIGYVTQWDVIVGKDNLPLAGQSSSTSLGSRTIAIAEIAGSTGVSQANTITVISPAINGITGVTNPIPTQPRTGLDAETDSQYRDRKKNIISQLNIDTQAFYEAQATMSNANVLRTIAEKNFSTDGVKILVRSRNAADFTQQELDNIAGNVEIYSRSFEPVTVENMVMTDITISFIAVLKTGVTLQSAYVQAADTIANFIDYALWDYDKILTDDDVIEQLLKITDIQDIDLSSFSLTAQKDGQPAGSGSITFIKSLPRFARLAITNSTDSELLDYTVSQSAIKIITESTIQPFYR
jgi:hypothetical protein